MHNSFILQEYLEDLTICDAIIKAHEESPNKSPGYTYKAGEYGINKEIKDSEDSFLYGSAYAAYNLALQKVVDKYVERYPQCNMYAPWGVLQTPHVQKYEPNGGFFQWHCERGWAKPEVASTRHLVFMTYLNDVTDGGETEFQLQEIKIQPRKGLTLIWPADWTHTHRGIASPTQTKYIVTGWFNFIK